MYHVGILHAGDVGVDQDSAGPEFGAFWMYETGLCCVFWTPIQLIGVVGHAVATGEFTRLLERLDEVVLLSIWM